MHTYFALNPATEFNVPNDIAIGEGAFYGNSYIERINIPVTVTEIGAGAFTSCINLALISLPMESVYSFDGRNLYDNRDSNELILHTHLYINEHSSDSEPYKIPDGVKTIYARAFENTNIYKVIINSEINAVGDYAFNGCKNLFRVYFEDDIDYAGVRIIDNNAADLRVYGPDYGMLPDYSRPKTIDLNYVITSGAAAVTGIRRNTAR